ncbi:MAG: tRNA pseudouridine(13) synthase TruD [Candidatus Diapherotrites archaeon CG08_land_8_20_14_0_20_30_16]|nr:MAG: tRNA pseudouridine(13) synthase TruD [Candidatus Diapherotrites archaeon CG08_land_8_20_14_0_20_30_16]
MYFTTTKSIKGTIKHRYSDFIVQELPLYGTVCRVLPEGVSEEYSIPENSDQRQFLHCTMHKINVDVQSAIKSIALCLKCGKSRIGFAGLKDKRGVTSQRISLFDPNLDLLRKFNYKQIKLFDFSWENEKIELGNLKGNSFTIIIRDINLEEKEIRNILSEFAMQTHFEIPNYFGEQRFGGIRQVTHLVGKLFFENKTKEAVLLYLGKQHSKESAEIQEARELASKERYLEAFKKFKGREFRYERAILNSLIKDPNDFVKAFQQLPKNLMILFPHAYQSYLFNKYLDMRKEKLGKDFFKVQKGDKLDSEGNILGPLFGFDYEFSEGFLGEIEKQILKEENIELAQFKVGGFPQMSVQGSYRPIKLDIFDFKLVEIGNDEFFENRLYAKISFNLTKNSYATVVLNELMKNNTE